MQQVYFAECRQNALVKVGLSRHATLRLRQISTEMGTPIELIGLIEGDRHIEQSIHNTLRQHRASGEWYHDGPEVRATIQNCFNNFKKIEPVPIRKYTAFSAVVRTLWPDKTAEKLAELSGSNVRTARRWLIGQIEPPAIIIAAIVVEITKR